MPAQCRSHQSSPAALLLIAALLLPAAARGQSSTVRGFVSDSSGAPIPEVDVAIVAQRLLTRTNARGEFRFSRVRPGELTLSLRKLGYEPRSIDVQLAGESTDSLSIVMAEQARLLEAMRISERDMRRRAAIEAFYRRRATGHGTFVTREEIEARRGASRLSDVLRNYPGMRFERSARGVVIRFVNSSSQRRDCVPQLWVDGQLVRGMEVDDFPVRDIEGVELYNNSSTTPLQYSSTGSTTTCGTIVLWSRVPGT